MRRFLLHSLFIIIIGISLVECQRWTSFNKAQGTSSKESYRNGRNGRYYGDSSQQNIETESPSKLQQNKNSSSSGGGVGAWGIIAITLTVILSGLGVYYFVTFYPIVCKKERMYDVMEMTTV